MDSVARVCEKGMTHFYSVLWSDTGSLDPNMRSICNYLETTVHPSAKNPATENGNGALPCYRVR